MTPSGKKTIGALGAVLVLVILFQWRPWEPRRYGLRLDECVSAIAAEYDHSSPFTTLSNVPPEVTRTLRAMPEAAVRRFIGMLDAPDETWFQKQVNVIEEFAKLKFEREHRMPEADVGVVGIGVLGPAAAPAIPKLERMLNSGENMSMARGLMGMVLVGLPAIHALTNATRHTNDGVRIDALYCLRLVAPHSAVVSDTALRLLQQGTHRERIRAVEIFCSTTNDVERSWGIVKRLIDDPDLEVRRAALYGLRHYGDRPLELVPRFKAQLRTNLSFTEVSNLASALRLWTNQPAAALECLIEGLQNPSDANRIPLLLAIERLRPPAEQILPVIEPLYLSSPTGACRQALGRCFMKVAPEAAARLNVETKLAPPVPPQGRGRRR